MVCTTHRKDGVKEKILHPEAEPRKNKRPRTGKPKAFRYVLRQSRKASLARTRARIMSAPRLRNGLVPNRWLSAQSVAQCSIGGLVLNGWLSPKQGHGGSAAAHSGKPPAYRSSFPGILLRLRLSAVGHQHKSPKHSVCTRIASSAAQIGTRSFLSVTDA